ncbi:MAG TPA: sigma-70 family RNA polymerase sigma factor [Terriglobia bacterium]|nr:sigma-70 family RNA polymerase sigma factor [Terriglobia bacterium]
MNLFRWNRCESPEDETQETLSRALERLNDPDTDIHVPLQAYVYGIARNVLREAARRRNREMTTDPGAPVFAQLSANFPLSEDDKILIQQCRAHLSAEEDHLVMEYHRKGAEEVARDRGITANAVRIRVHRIHRKIQELMIKE